MSQLMPLFGLFYYYFDLILCFVLSNRMWAKNNLLVLKFLKHKRSNNFFSAAFCYDNLQYFMASFTKCFWQIWWANSKSTTTLSPSQSGTQPLTRRSFFRSSQSLLKIFPWEKSSALESRVATTKNRYNPFSEVWKIVQNINIFLLEHIVHKNLIESPTLNSHNRNLKKNFSEFTILKMTYSSFKHAMGVNSISKMLEWALIWDWAFKVKTF